MERLLRAISAQTLSAAEFEVIVSIDGSDDGACEIVNEAAVPYRLQAIWHLRQGRAARAMLAFESLSELAGRLQASPRSAWWNRLVERVLGGFATSFGAIVDTGMESSSQQVGGCDCWRAPVGL